MNILVTGGNGFIGTYMCRALYDKGHTIRIVDVDPGGQDSLHYDVRIADVSNNEELMAAMEGVDLVIHLAAKHRFFGISKEEFYRINVQGTKNVLDAMDRHGVRNIIFYSSVAVYGAQEVPTDENTMPRPDTPYGITKLEGEQLINKWVSANGERNALILRPTVIFGPRNRGNIFRLIRQIDRYFFLLVGTGQNIKSIVFVDNIVDATLFLLDRGFRGVEVYNYADHPHMSFKEIVALIYRHLGRSSPKISLPVAPVLIGLKPFDYLAKAAGLNFPVSDAIKKMNKSTYHTADKIRRAGFHQGHSLEEGLRRMIEWYLSERGNDGRSHE